MASAAEVGIAPLVDPIVSTGHAVSVRGLIDTIGGVGISLQTEVRQGANALSTPATFTDTLTSTAQTFTHILSAAQADSITDYSALRFRFTATSSAASAIPTFVGVNTAGASATTGTLTVPWPTTGSGAAAAYATNDIGLLFVETQGAASASLSTPAGFVELPNSPQTTGTAGAGSKLSVYWCRATSASMTSPVMTAGTDHQFGIIIAFRGCTTVGNPWDATPIGGVKAGASTTTSTTGVTTTQVNCLIVEAVTKDLDSAAAFASGQTNAALASITERFDAGTVSGNGGGIAIHTGTKATVGATGATSITVTSSISTFMTIALQPPPLSKARVTWAELVVPVDQLTPVLFFEPLQVRMLR